jgi:Tol biopolymer transport system component
MQANDNKTLVPVMIEPCKRPIMFELTHTADLSQWTGDRKDNAWQSFLAGVRLFVERGAPVPAALPAASASRASVSPIIRASRRGTGNRTTKVALGFAILGMALLAVPAIRYLRETPPPETRLEINTPATDQPKGFALSPDGRQIVFVASGDSASRLWLRPLATTAAQPLADTEGATSPFWSPDSRSIGFFADGALKRLDLSGGAPQNLAPAPGGSGGTWNAEGVILFAPGQSSPLMRVSATGGAAVAATTVMAKQIGHYWPFFLPDGQRFLFAANGAADTTGIYLGDLTGGALTRLTKAPSAPAYLPSGWMLWARDGALVAQRLDVAKAALTGAPVTLAGGLSAGLAASAASVSATGLIAYRVGAASQVQLAWFDRSGAAQGSVDQRGDVPRVAPDGRRVVVSINSGGPSNIWLLDGSRISPLTSGTINNYFGMWSPDGTRIVFGSNRSGGFDLYEKLVNGAVGDEQPLLTSGQVKVSGTPTSWSPDGRYLLYFNSDPGPNTDLWVLPMTGPHKRFPFLQSSFTKSWGVFSPDGRWVAYQSDESGRNEIFVRPFHPPGAKDSDAASAAVQWQVSTAGGVAATWRPDGKEIDYIDPSGAMMAAPITVSGATLVAGTPAKLFQTKILDGGKTPVGREYDVAPDGRFLINNVVNSAAAPITLIQHWNPDVTKQ